MKFSRAINLTVFFGLILTISMSVFAQKTIWKVENKGAMREMFDTGNIDGTIEINRITTKKNLYAVGPLDNLSGEIMIWNGKVLTCFLKNNSIVTETNPNAGAVFFVWSNVEKWNEIKVPNSVKTYDELEKFIAEAAEKSNLDASEPFPFLLKGVFQKVDWHINDYKPDGSKITREKHDAMKFKSKTENKNLEFLGFYSEKHKGIFTHHTRLTHIHVTDKKRKFIGHVDDLTNVNALKLYLPSK
ncbi:MAG TPA: acetolactate decarboxylase [Pyrinomonadaceae bacterium]|nr:acetolactate decarboxylase [Pyrinomonadaceae bacterium]